MPYYRFFFVDADKHIIGHSMLELKDDESAEVRADKLLAASGHCGIEIWDRARLLYRKMKDNCRQA